MKIGIDATLFMGDSFTGIARSVYEILDSWMKNDTENEYYLFSHKPIILDFKLPSNWHFIVNPWIVDKGRLWRWFQLPKDIKNYDIEVFWGNGYFLPRRVRGVKYVVTIYDVALFLFDNIGDPKAESSIKKDIVKSCKRADKIVAISNATKSDIMDIFSVEDEKIAVSYCGGLPQNFSIDNNCFPDNDNLKFDEEYFLFISTIEPRKNVLTIIKAFEKFSEESDKEVKLVLAGKKGWRCDDIYLAVESSKYKNRIIMPGYISANDKAYLLNNAKAFVYPSLYEGFGIPILEAFAYGVPVITTNISSMPEVGADACFYIDEATNVNELAQYMKFVINLNDEEKKVLQDKMLKRLEEFSWKKNADEMIKIFDKLR